nr:LPXTG cell wall anchor domain-containing protein [Angustibacter aerolatus]
MSVPAAAMAAGNDDYPASTPSVTVSGVSVAANDAEVANTSASNAALPRTGTDVAVWGGAGLALVVGGALLVTATRRRGVRA